MLEGQLVPIGLSKTVNQSQPVHGARTGVLFMFWSLHSESMLQLTTRRASFAFGAVLHPRKIPMTTVSKSGFRRPVIARS